MSVETRILNFQLYVGKRLRQINKQLVTEEITVDD